MNRSFIRSLVSLALVCIVGVATAQDILFTIDGVSASDEYGRSVSATGDVDMDGVGDFAVGAPGVDVGGTNSGGMDIRSGANGSIIHSVNGTAAKDYLGWSVAAAGDLNGDGYPDVIIGAPQVPFNGTSNAPGYAVAMSGKDGATLWTARPPQGQASSAFGLSVDGIGDVNNDGFVDGIVGQPYLIDYYVTKISGKAHVLSGKDGTQIRQHAGHAEASFLNYREDRLGYHVSGFDDFDQDGFADYLVCARIVDKLYGTEPQVHLYSGQTGALHKMLSGPAPTGTFAREAGDINGNGSIDIMFATTGGMRIWDPTTAGGIEFIPDFTTGAPAGDADGDGAPDLVLARNTHAPELSLFSPVSKTILFEYTFAPPVNGLSVDGIGDINGDGYDDFVAGNPFSQGTGAISKGLVTVFSGCRGKRSLYGVGCPGTGGIVPALSFLGCPEPSSPVSIEFTDGLGGAAALLMFGSQGSQPIGYGCTFLLSSAFPPILGFPLSPGGVGDGSASLQSIVSSSFPVGLTIAVQGFVIDPGASGGFCATNGLEFQVN